MTADRAAVVAVERLTEAVDGIESDVADAAGVMVNVGDLRVVLRRLAALDAQIGDTEQQVTENDQEFLMRTLSRSQWKVVARCLRAEVDAATAQPGDTRAPLPRQVERGAECFHGTPRGCLSIRCGSDCTDRFDRMHPCPTCLIAELSDARKALTTAGVNPWTLEPAQPGDTGPCPGIAHRQTNGAVCSLCGQRGHVQTGDTGQAGRYTDGDVNHVLQPVVGLLRLHQSNPERWPFGGEAIGGAIDRMLQACASERQWLAARATGQAATDG